MSFEFWGFNQAAFLSRPAGPFWYILVLLYAGLGLLAAVELSDPEKLARVIDEARARGVLLRGLRGVALQISPPFVITEDEIATLARVVGESLDAAA